MSDGETTVYLCDTEGCGGFVDDPDEEPCPRCGRIMNDPSPAHIERDVQALQDRIERQIDAVEGRIPEDSDAE